MVKYISHKKQYQAQDGITLEQWTSSFKDFEHNLFRTLSHKRHILRFEAQFRIRKKGTSIITKGHQKDVS